VPVAPTDWFRVRHAEPFSDEAVAAFEASCAIFRARMEATLQQWERLPLCRATPRLEVAAGDWSTFAGPRWSKPRCGSSGEEWSRTQVRAGS
jgi:hypothetical protein